MKEEMHGREMQFGDYLVITGHDVKRKLVEEAKEQLIEQYFTWDFYKQLWRHDCVTWVERETRMHDVNTGEEFDCTTVGLKFSFVRKTPQAASEQRKPNVKKCKGEREIK